MSRFIWTIIFIVLGVIVLIVAYWFVGGFLATPDSSMFQQGESMSAEIITDEKIKLVSNKEIISYWFDDEGRLYLMETTGEVVGVSSQKLEGINQVEPSANGQRVLVGYDYPDDLTFAVMDIAKQSWTTLPEGTIAVAWHPTDSNRIVYLQNSGLKIMNLETGRSNVVLGFNLIDVTLDWPDENRILVADRPTAVVGGKVWEISLSNKTIKEVASGGGVIVKENDYWQMQFFGSINRRADRLILVNKEDEDISVDVSSLFSDANIVTLPEKCVSEQFKIYCAFPKDISPAVTLPDDYLKRKFISDDGFYAIVANPQGGIEADLVYNPLSAVDATNLKKIGDKLYFLNRRDSKLYYLELAK